MLNKNNSVLISLVLLVIGMCCLAYASVPLYRLFCQTTGYGGTTQRAEKAKNIKPINRYMTVTFNTDVAPDLPWQFYPEQKSVKIKIGENKVVYFVAENLSDKDLTGQAIYNVTPNDAGIYFTKIQCFCFDKQKLKAREKAELPVSFFIDPEIVKDKTFDHLETITLSYTFFKVKK